MLEELGGTRAERKPRLSSGKLVLAALSPALFVSGGGAFRAEVPAKSEAQQSTTPTLSSSAPFTVAYTSGRLEVLKFGDDFAPDFQLKWNGKSLIVFGNDRTLHLLNRTGKEGALLLLEFGSQGVDCPNHYRVVDMSVKPEPFISGDIGDCSRPREVVADPDGFRIVFPGWRFPQRTVAPGAWRYVSPLTGSPGKLTRSPVARVPGRMSHVTP